MGNRYRVSNNEDGTFTGTYDGLPHLEAYGDSFDEALQNIQETVEDEGLRLEITAGDEDFYAA